MIIEEEYKTPRDNIVADFYIPVISNANLYKRAVGYFSSTALIKFTQGLAGLIKNGGKIQLITSPHLSIEDYKAISKGLEEKDKLIEKRLAEMLFEPKGYFEEERLNLVANLIALDKLEIKIAFSYKKGELGLYHEKNGIVYNKESDEIIAFSGSMNESGSALESNYETIDIYTSWRDMTRIDKKIEAFDMLWNDKDENAKVYEMPDIIKKSILKYKRNEVNMEIDREELEKIQEEYEKSKTIKPHLPEWLELREYQKNAISSWKSNNYHGIYDMATGTGKTFTALASVVDLYKELKGKLAVIIVCPYQHLVEQWSEDAINFGMKPILCYSSSFQRDWKSRIKNLVRSFEFDLIDNFCVITTNATFATNFMQSNLKELRGNTLLVVDEAHNLGTDNYAECLLSNFKYRLALSATIERYEDEIGTQKLYDYFGEKCIIYSLKDAIDNDMLTPYYYHPIIVNFDENELDEYLDISKEISRHLKKDKFGKQYLDDIGKSLLIKRARLVAGTKEKLFRLRDELEEINNDSHILIYSGATTLHDVDYIEGQPPKSEIRQIDAIVSMVGNELDMKVAKFTSEESIVDRELIKKEFESGKRLQVLAAIRCLDEGVNIPSIKTAFILASSTNPKEYIQRRGRVLRKHPGKEAAHIYDFITVPIPLENLTSYPDNVVKSVKSLVRKELVRMIDFAKIAKETYDIDDLIFDLRKAYAIDLTEESKGENEYE